MFVIFLVAAVTVQRGVLVPILCVTFFTHHFRVLSSEGIFRLVVVETDFLPAGLGMAIRARLPNPPFMLVVFFVTGIAGGRRISKLCFRFVTGLAFHLLGIRMRTAQGKIGLCMIERLFVDWSDVLSSAFVVGVTFLALALFLQTSVKSLLLRDIGAYILMAILAELSLCGFVESLMTLGAVVLPFGMSLDDLSGHERRFQIVCPGERRHEQHDAKNDCYGYAVLY